MGVNGSESSSQRAVSARGRLERRGARALAPAGATPHQRDLQKQQLVVGEPAAAALVVAEVRGVERRRAVREPVTGPQVGRERLERLLRGAAPLPHQREDLGRRQAVGGRVGGDLRRLGADRIAGFGVELHAEAVAGLELALQQQARAGPVLALEPRLVEERGLDRAGLVGHDRLDERAHATPPDRPAGDRAHLDDDRRGLARRKLGERPRVLAVARQVVEEVADRVELQPLRGGRRLCGADLQRRQQPRRPRVARRPSGMQRVVGQRVRGGERGRRHSPQ